MVTGSAGSDWEMLPPGPLYLDRLGEVVSAEGHWVEVDTHHYMAVYREDVDLRLAWGLQVDDRLRFEGLTFLHDSISRFAVDAFWHGALVARWYLLLVDEGRCYLPNVGHEFVRTSDSALGGVQPFALSATASEIRLATLLNDLVGRHSQETASYFEQANVIELPDE